MLGMARELCMVISENVCNFLDTSFATHHPLWMLDLLDVEALWILSELFLELVNILSEIVSLFSARSSVRVLTSPFSFFMPSTPLIPFKFFQVIPEHVAL